MHAVANSATFNFIGSVSCIQGSCNPLTGTVTGTISNDFSNSQIVGTWSFSSPVGAFSSSGLGALGTAFAPFPNTTVFTFCNDANCDILMELLFADTSLQNGGPLLTSFNGKTNLSGICVTSATSNVCNPFYTFTSGTLFTPGTLLTTPEPSSAVLLLTGLLGIGASYRRKYLGY